MRQGPVHVHAVGSTLQIMREIRPVHGGESCVDRRIEGFVTSTSQSPRQISPATVARIIDSPVRELQRASMKKRRALGSYVYFYLVSCNRSRISSLASCSSTSSARLPLAIQERPARLTSARGSAVLRTIQGADC